MQQQNIHFLEWTAYKITPTSLFFSFERSFHHYYSQVGKSWGCQIHLCFIFLVREIEFAQQKWVEASFPFVQTA